MRLVLLDRDGVLNEDRPHSVRTLGDLVLLPRAADAVARLNGAGLRVAIVTNQSIVGQGIIDAAMLDRIHDRLRDELARVARASTPCSWRQMHPTRRRRGASPAAPCCAKPSSASAHLPPRRR